MVTMMKIGMLEVDFIRELYAELSESPDYDDFTRYMMDGEACCLALSKPNAVDRWREDIGPKVWHKIVTISRYAFPCTCQKKLYSTVAQWSETV